MDDAFAAAMRAELEAMREELEAVAETGEASAGTVELDQQRVGRLSRMDAMQAQAMAQASGRRREETLRGIASALARLRDAGRRVRERLSGGATSRAVAGDVLRLAGAAAAPER